MLPSWLSGKEFACQCRRCRFHPWVRKLPWRRKWQPIIETSDYGKMFDFRYCNKIASENQQCRWLDTEIPVTVSRHCHLMDCLLNVRSVTQLCPALCDLMDCGLPGFSVHGILQARTLEWVVIFSSRGSSRPRDQACVSGISCIGRQVLYHCATWELPIQHLILVKRSSVYYRLLFTTL